MDAEHRLAVYGTLAPGEVNHGQLAGLRGRWLSGSVNGHLFEDGWGAALGFPAIVLAADGPRVDVEVLESEELATHWDRLDRFEGPAYLRTVTTVATDDGPLDANIYTLRAGDEPPPTGPSDSRETP